MNEIVGTQIGIYNVLYECKYKANDGHKKYRVKCIYCGFETEMIKSQIKRTTQCKHKNKAGFYINNKICFKNQRIHNILKLMIQRCYDPNSKDYKWYGGKGITICDEWLSNTISFEDWAMANGYQDNLTIDRIDENKNQCPENCRWISNENNARYKSTTRLITVDEETHSGKEWSKILGLATNAINTYVRKHGMDNTIKYIKNLKNKKF